jgi:hypothetical protein
MPQDLVSRHRADRAYEAGRRYRESRLPFEACPHRWDHPLRVWWERGWRAQLIFDLDSESLLDSMKNAGLIAPLDDLERLDVPQRQALLRWLELRPDLAAPIATPDGRPIRDTRLCRRLFESRRPSFVDITDRTVPTALDWAELRVVKLSFRHADA